jgi:hypothetical protein
MIRHIAASCGATEISEIGVFDETNSDYNKLARGDDWHWALIQASKGVSITKAYIVRVWPGMGCEEANFGFVRYGTSKVWEWHSFCKTQYASELGQNHFVHCHLIVVSILDYLKSVGLVQDVSDEGNYWETRSIDALTGEVDSMNKMIAALAGALIDVFGRDNTQAPILDYPDFERLEMAGLEQSPNLFEFIKALKADESKYSEEE